MYRVENKYCCSETDFLELQGRIGNVLASDTNECGEHGYSVISLYFDDWEDSCFQDTLNGREIRDKYRIRIYNNCLEEIRLEVKRKKDCRVSKASRRISEKQLYRLMNGQCIEDERSAQDPATLFNLAIQMCGLKPRIIVAYERKAYVFDAGNTRITFDRNIRASNWIEQFGQKSINYDFLHGHNAVLEVKYDEFIPDFVLQLLELGNLQQSSYSKYQLCRELYANHV